MVAAVTTDVSQLQVMSVLGGGDIDISQLGVISVFNFPAETIEMSQLQVNAVTTESGTTDVSQLQVVAVVRGRVTNRRVRAWEFSLDGHHYYVLRLGETSTIVYDATTQQWMDWASPDLAFLRQQNGLNWLDMGNSVFSTNGQESNVVAGDDTFGLLWLVDAEQGFDESPIDASTRRFERKVTGGVPMRMRETQKCAEVYLTASGGDPVVSGDLITLRTSDDFGNTWTDHGGLAVTSATYDQEFAWRSLGLIKYPGRIFELTDDGAVFRIDGLDMR